ncbi:antifreeze protein Maxi-like [Zingiber officinale]|uniref:antifreeze protein Maxi-like n=1 Tax=Zingiber officinale TaxID=94328 RepID=UPI001C4D2C64|nr:antifreeze protein Maxi-like [Zingiber officinale]
MVILPMMIGILAMMMAPTAEDGRDVETKAERSVAQRVVVTTTATSEIERNAETERNVAGINAMVAGATDAAAAMAAGAMREATAAAAADREAATVAATAAANRQVAAVSAAMVAATEAATTVAEATTPAAKAATTAAEAATETTTASKAATAAAEAATAAATETTAAAEAATAAAEATTAVAARITPTLEHNIEAQFKVQYWQAIDANDNVLPVAFGIAEVECGYAWEWFLDHTKRFFDVDPE